MKIVVERVPAGVQVSITPPGQKKPTVFTIRPEQLDTLVNLVRGAMAVDTFRLEYTDTQ